MNNDSLGDRMKGYENVSRIYLPSKIPVIIRIDGKAFHSFTRGMQKPFDKILMSAMQDTMLGLCTNIQGCVFGYTQSDEITLVLTDYDKPTTHGWFGYNIQKIASISASAATLIFNKLFAEKAGMYLEELGECWHLSEDESKYSHVLERAIESGGMFDARAFTLPKEEVVNCLIWRQQDATRNSIESAGRAFFSDKELYKKNCNAIQEMLFQEKGINWNDYDIDCKRGAACYKVPTQIEVPDPNNSDKTILIVRNKWRVDREIPVFTQDREFINKWL